MDSRLFQPREGERVNSTIEEVSPEAAELEWDLTRKITGVARSFKYDEKHTNQVLALSMRLFYQLEELHHLGYQEKLWLKWAALLHDIGWIEGQKQHHKVTLQIILSTNLLPFDSKERLIIGSIARYHRKSLPSPSHDHFAALDAEEQDKVLRLAALLRLADGLDGSHRQVVQRLDCDIKPKKVAISCRVNERGTADCKNGQKKGDLFELAYQKEVEIKFKKAADTQPAVTGNAANQVKLQP
jgi:exopolyphosphatase/pppGpp-phosphohydrolase